MVRKSKLVERGGSPPGGALAEYVAQFRSQLLTRLVREAEQLLEEAGRKRGAWRCLRVTADETRMPHRLVAVPANEGRAIRLLGPRLPTERAVDLARAQTRGQASFAAWLQTARATAPPGASRWPYPVNSREWSALIRASKHIQAAGMPTLPWAAAETDAVADYALTRRSVTEMQQADSAAIQSFFALRHAESAQASLQKVRAGSRGAGARPTMTRMRNERMRSDFLTCVIHDGMKSREAVAFLAKREGLAVEIVRRNLHPQELMKNLRASGVVAQISRRRRKPLP